MQCMHIKIDPPTIVITPGTTTIPAGQVIYVGPTLPKTPNICPGCGRCKDCGQHAAPVLPAAPPYVWPAGQWPYDGVICGTTNVGPDVRVWS